MGGFGDPPPPPPPDPQPSGDGDSGGGSPSGGGGGGGKKDNPVEPFLLILQNLGFVISGDARAFAKKAASGEWSSGEFMYNLRQQGFYRDRFRGIFRRDGRLRMSESEYVRLERSYQHMYRNLTGRALERDQIATLIRGEKSVREFQQSFAALRAVKATEATRQAFNQVLKAADRKELNREGWFKFVMGEADAKLYNLYEASRLVTLGFQAAEAKRLSKQIGEPGAPAGGFGQLTEILNKFQQEAAQELAASGVTQQDMALVALHESGEALSGDALERALRTREVVNQVLRNRMAREQVSEQVAPQSQSGRPISPQAAPRDLVSPA